MNAHYPSPRLLSLLLALAAPVPGGAQVSPSPERPATVPGQVGLRVIPERPVQGKLFVISTTGFPPEKITGSFAGEPLHFYWGSRDSQRAIAAVPVDAEGEMELVVEATYPETNRPAQTVRLMVPIAPGAYRMERLRVAPAFTELSPALERRTEEEAARARQVALGAHNTARMWGDSIVRPRPGRITSGFGNGREFNGTVTSRHTGTDFEGAVGTAVVAPMRGVVALVDQFYLGGNVIYIDHGGGLSTGYLHLSETRVAAGDTVQAGQRIGSVGATGRVTGPHLHWILRFGRITVDPLSVLELNLP